MHNFLRALFLSVLLTAICLCQSKDDYIVDHQQTIQNKRPRILQNNRMIMKANHNHSHPNLR